MARHRDLGTLNLFDWQPPQVAVGYGEEVTGRGPLEMRISRLVAKALSDVRDEGTYRSDIAVKMSKFLDRPVTKEMLNKWSSVSSDNRIPLDAFAALIEATGKHDLLGFLPSLFGFSVVSSQFEDLIKLHQMREHQAKVAQHENQINAEIAALEARVKGRR